VRGNETGETMKTLTQLGFGCALLVLAGCSDSADSSGSSNEPTVAGAVRELIDGAVDSGFSGAILVTADGERLTSEAHGLADRDRDTANTPETAFDVGSILKSLTATAIFRLTEDEVVTLDTTLADVFADVPDDKADITLRELIQHRAGLDEYHDTEGDFEPMTRGEARAHIFEQELLFEPDSYEAYSNSGYTLLADVIETVSGETYVGFVRSAVLEPADMSSSGFYSEPLWADIDTALGYEASTFGDNDPASWPYTWALVGNGGLVTTVGDLDRFLAALFGGRIVAPVTLDVMRGVYFSAGEATVGGEPVYAEAGAGDFGLGGVAVFAPESDTRVIIATNTSDAFDVEALATDLALELLEPD
jgi:CubicO group peptidase (beta-lactamase class C family)